MQPLFLQRKERLQNILALPHAVLHVRTKPSLEQHPKDVNQSQGADPLPIARRSDGDRRSGSSPGSSSSLLRAFPGFPSDVSCRFARCYSGGTAPALPASLLSLATPDPSICCLLFIVMMASKRKNIIAFGYCQEMATGVSQPSSDSIFSLRSCLLDNSQIQI